jgi:uncharacterized protein YozE (UPF0346 family)
MHKLTKLLFPIDEHPKTLANFDKIIRDYLQERASYGFKHSNLPMRHFTDLLELSPKEEKCHCGQLWTNHDYSSCDRKPPIPSQPEKVLPSKFPPKGHLDDMTEVVRKINEIIEYLRERE